MSSTPGHWICHKLHVSVALQGLMPNYVKVVPSIAIAFVSYEQVNVSSPGLHCDCSAACHQHQTDCHVPTSLTLMLLCNMSPAFESTQNSLGRQAFLCTRPAHELNFVDHVATVNHAFGISIATIVPGVGNATHISKLICSTNGVLLS